jgi:CO dehydrogenase maturation factor
MGSPCIAIVGKGGVGKTTLAAFTLRYLLERGVKPILAVDADPSMSLPGVLGVQVEETIGGIREDTRSTAKGVPDGVPKQQYLAMKIEEALVEAKGFDLLAMGRPEGQGCYCFVNNVLRDHLDRLTKSYKATVIDCEAGLEHISRRTTRSVDTLIMVADPTLKAINTLGTILELTSELDGRVERKLLVLSKVSPGSETRVQEAAFRILGRENFEAVGIIPQDGEIFEAELAGTSLLNAQLDLSAYRSYVHILDALPKPLVS